VTLHLLYFGVLKDFFEADRDLVELPEDSTVADLLALLRDGVSDLPVWSSLAVAVNREYATLDSPLHDGDEVALLPPVSGGASCA
jgi:molybdopterin converting factor small subunit